MLILKHVKLNLKLFIFTYVLLYGHQKFINIIYFLIAFMLFITNVTPPYIMLLEIIIIVVSFCLIIV